MNYCKICLSEKCEIEHTVEEIEEAEKKANELREALQKLVAYAKLLEENN